jgi:hypothetical protein
MRGRRMAAKTYTHSETFALLKNTSEGIPHNLTTYQWLSVLDYFIESALDPISTAWPDFVDNYFAKVVAWQFYKPAVKFSRNSKEIMPHVLFNALTTEGATKRKWQKELMLNRGLLFGVISMFLEEVKPYMKLHDPRRPLTANKKAASAAWEARTSTYLHASILQVQYWDGKAHWFKSLLSQKYIRMALMNAKRTYIDVEHAIELDDIIQTFLIYMSKAIDRCDARQGVLTTFIQTWFYSARSEILRSVASDRSSSYEELVETNGHEWSTSPDESFESLQHLAATAKKLDPIGLVRFSLGIPEFVSNRDLLILGANCK